MSSTVIPLSVQEAAADFANNIVAQLNQVAAEMAGIDVMWFRLQPDKRSQDVIFQSYTLYGVEDCPLQFKAVYSDTGYDDAAITYNIMGLEYSVPLTLEIPVNTWYEITNNDGTTPQRGDIVFIPLSNKLVEVVSMTPIKAIAAQVTSFKVNCSAYKPSRSRIVGDNLKESIEQNTVNLESQFGKDIENTLKDIVDDNQLSLYNSSTEDKHKNVTPTRNDDDLLTNKHVDCIKSGDLIVDGHIAARTYYDAEIDSSILVTYKATDNVDENDIRSYSCWLNIKPGDTEKNIKTIIIVKEETNYYLDITLSSGKLPKPGENVVIERGNLLLVGTVIEHSPGIRVKVHSSVIEYLNKSIPTWNNLPGFTLKRDNVINLLSLEGSSNVIISLKGANYISILENGKELLCQLSYKLKAEHWYGIIINMGKTVNVDIFDNEDGLNRNYSSSDIVNKFWTPGLYEKIYICSSACYITNIRYFNTGLYDLDKQITNLVTYNVSNNSSAIINDSADTYLDKKYMFNVK